MAEESLVVDTSFSQQSLWLQNRIDPGQASYNVTAAVRLRGPLDTGVLERALNTVVERHEALRTVFELDGGEPVQVIGPMQQASPLHVPVLDATPEDFEETARAELAAPFDLSRGPLIRLSLLRLAEQDHVALLVMHHIVTDGASSGIFFQELTAAYEAYATGRQPQFPELPIQYADFAVWQREHLTGDLLQRLTDYWSAELAGAEPPELPTDRPRPAAPSGRGGTHHFDIPAPLVHRLETLARRRNATPFMVFLAAFNVLLARYSGQHDITVTSPVSGRPRPELEGLIGYFVNPLLLRTDLSGDPGFLELLDRVRERCLAGYRNQELPFEQATDLLRRQRPSGRLPEGQVMMVLQAKAPLRWESAGLDFEMTDIDTGTAKADLALDIRPTGAGHHVVLQYSADLFDAGTADRIGAHFLSVLEAVGDRPERTVSELPLQSAEERDAVLAAGHGPVAAPVTGRIPEAVAERAARTPAAPAVVAGDGRLDHRELDRRATELAHRLEKSGMRAGAAVVLSMAPSCALVVGALATLKAGGSCLPVDPTLPEDTVRKLVDASGAALVLSADGVQHVDGADETAPAEPSDVALLSWTDAGDGTFATAGLSHGAVLTAARDTAQLLSLTSGDRWLCTAPQPEQLLRQLFPVLLHGATLVLPGAPGEAAATPSVLSLAGLHPQDFPATVGTASRVVVGDAAESVRRATELVGDGAARAFLLAELPETAGALAVREPDRDTAAPGGWRPPGHTLHVLDDRLEPAPLGVPGELYAGGPTLGSGYPRRPGLTAAHFVPDPYGARPGGRLLRTGERARRLPDGTLDLLGRTGGRWRADGLRPDAREPGPVPEPAGGHGAYTAPRTPFEAQVARIWEELLEVERVGAYDNFFDLGGHSLLAVRLAARLRDDFGTDIAVRDLYADFTVAEVAWKVLQRLVEAEAEAEAAAGAGTEDAAHARGGAVAGSDLAETH